MNLKRIIFLVLLFCTSVSYAQNTLTSRDKIGIKHNRVVYWNGSAWTPVGDSGVVYLIPNAIGSSPNANGLSISGNTITLQPANGSNGGIISLSAQVMGAGQKTFAADLFINTTLRAGRGLGNSTSNTAFGATALNSTKSSSVGETAIGFNALGQDTIGSNNTAIGATSLQLLRNGYNNTAGGSESLSSNVNGIENTALGYQSLKSVLNSYNIGIGTGSGYSITSGQYNIVIGRNLPTFGITSGSYNTIIGNQINGLASTLSNNIIISDGQGNIKLQFNESNALAINNSYGTAGQVLVSNGSSGATAWTSLASYYFKNPSSGEHLAYNLNDTTLQFFGVITKKGIQVNKTINVDGDSLLVFSVDTTTIYNTQTASYSLVLTDQYNTSIVTNVGSANNLTIPLNSSVAFPIGTTIEIIQSGTGQTTIVPTGGVTLNSTGGKNKTTGQYSKAYLEKTGTDTWLLSGDISN